MSKEDSVMLFKLCYTVDRLDIHSREPLEVDLNVPESIRCILRAPTEEEKAKGHKSFNALLDVLGEFEPSKRSLPVFTALIDGKRPPEGQKARSAEEMIIREGPSYGLEHYPDPFVSFVNVVMDRLALVGYGLVSVLRWRYAQEGPPSPISGRGLFCSNDAGASWYPIPGRYSIISVTPPHSVFMVQGIDVNEITGLITTNVQEPVYHELLREAKELQHSSPRSAVLIAVSAVEVAVKSVVVNRVPESAWLVESMQSPPIVDILIQYIPVLFPYEQMFYDATKKHGLIKTVYDAVHIRNQMVHKGIHPPSKEKVAEILDATQQLLWICDYYSGHSWAKLHIDARKPEII